MNLRLRVSKNEEARDYSQGRYIRFAVVDLDKSNNGVLVIFPSKKQMTVKTIAHESVHVATQIFSDCNMGFSFEAGMDEHFAYLVGWAADCMNNIRTGNVQNLKTLSNQK